MGRQLVNDLDADSEHRGLSQHEYYLKFLKEALQDKQPGLGNLILSSEHPSGEVLDTFRTPIGNHQNYTTVVIDTRAFEDSGTLIIDIEVGRGDADGTFFLVNGDIELFTGKGITKDQNLASVWSEPGETGRITHCFDHGQLFKLCATGYSDEEEEAVNAFSRKNFCGSGRLRKGYQNINQPFSVFRRGWVTQPLLITDIRQSYKPVSVLFKSSDNLVCRFDRSRTVCILIFRFSIV